MLLANPDQWPQEIQQLQQQISQANAPDLPCKLFASRRVLCARHRILEQQMAYSDSCLQYGRLIQLPLLLVKGLHVKDRALANIEAIQSSAFSRSRASRLRQ